MVIRGVIVAALAGASVLAAGVEGTALADPPPSPAHAKRKVWRHPPRTVVRCQSDGTDQINEIDDDSDEPRHYVSPDDPTPAGRCPDIRQALGIADLLDGGAARSTRPRPTTRAVR
jgi:hypothetical protein